jgi:hypothetical protein
MHKLFERLKNWLFRLLEEWRFRRIVRKMKTVPHIRRLYENPSTIDMPDGVLEANRRLQREDPESFRKLKNCIEDEPPQIDV